ncbi:hypothetical protein [Oscillatoria acuminata]|uniref:Uncharacterized protein n=1 Tax=Oscillatoria acuminata PCC 6304 TaxID=56110 RepID=K9TD03_9CYAN|nr:hypothetical protein [Oscillatoria acuminata]AFY80415.1 hypothetical protein Oscil6304_0675 [Oscillatoria acuminata PCC 6304]
MKNPAKTHRSPRLVKGGSHSKHSPEEIARLEAELEELMERCDAVFERAKADLINDYYDWFMVIEPESGDYFLDPNDRVAEEKARAKYPDAQCAVYCVNETGSCYRV